MIWVRIFSESVISDVTSGNNVKLVKGIMESIKLLIKIVLRQTFTTYYNQLFKPIFQAWKPRLK